MTDKNNPRLTLPDEPWLLFSLKGALYLGAIVCYLVFFTSSWALWSALVMGVLALVTSHLLLTKLTLRGVLVIGGLVGGVGILLSVFLESWSVWSHLLGAPNVLRCSEMLFFGSLSFMVIFLLRAWGRQSRVGSGLEGLIICNAVVQLFSTHRLGQVHEPRFFSDWVIISGNHTVQWWLTVFGIGLVAIALVIFSRVRRTLHLLWATCLIIGLLLGVYWFSDLGHNVKTIEPLMLGGGGGGGGGGGKGNGDGKGDSGKNSPPNHPPTPVAVAVFHDDYAPENGILYFRQQVLSYFDGVKLVADSAQNFDKDVLIRFPNESDQEAFKSQAIENHLEVSTSMYLIDDHPTPPALTHAKKITPLDNPAPQRFVKAYGVRSLVSAVPLNRYVGRNSIPSSWSESQRTFYLDTHSDDPRYLTLAEEIVRDLPARLSADPIQRAVAIKRYLEREGYYTLKVKHRSSKDPAASFLFGDLRGYCVHFAHSAVHLLRSQGIAARVALGYAVDARTRSNSSAVLITGDRAHAWPEIYIDGVGWVTFDIYPEQSDESTSQSVSQSLESLFGEMARKQLDRGAKRGSPFPWRSVIWSGFYILFSLILLGYFIGIWRMIRLRFVPEEMRGKLDYLVVLDRLAGSGLQRQLGESREAYALRVRAWAPGLSKLTQAHLGWALGHPDRRASRALEVKECAREVRKSYAKRSRGRWLLSILNPFSWAFSR
jgi:protein-glutamine gamma-glutamyltransferase